MARRGIFGFVKDVVGRFLEAHCTLHAAGLTYFSMLTLIPVLCCILVTAKACGVDHFARGQINRRIDAAIQDIAQGQDDALAQLAPQSAEAREKKRIAAEAFAHQARQLSNELFGRIEAFNVGTLGCVGFAFLLWTVISSLGMVELSFNEIWRVPKPRPVWKRTYTYLFIIVVLPVLATVALSLPILNVIKEIVTATLGTSALTKWVGDGLLALLDSSFVRIALTLVASTGCFGFVFWVMPNVRVTVRSAGVGGLVAAVLFGGWMRLCAVAQVGIARSSALYGSFAFFPIILAWLYVSWQIILLGACFVHRLELRRPS